MASNVTLRHAQRSDIPTLAQMANDGYAHSVVHRRIAPYQDQHPIDYRHWRLNITRQRFVTPNIRTIVAVDEASGELLGQAAWVVDAADTALHREWASSSTWMDWLERKLLGAEQTWRRYVTTRCIDTEFLTRFLTVCMGAEQAKHPPCLHLQMIVVDPSTQSRGVGRLLVDWGKELALKENLPILLEATLEATAFYEKGGFARLSHDLVIDPKGQEPVCMPFFVWEGKQREGRWLERDIGFDGVGDRWRWKNDVLLKSSNSLAG